MRKFLPLALLFLALATGGRADDRLRDVQTELKSLGFYYGEVNGQNSGETSAAIRRYQIRNGLEVTGTLTDETIKALGIGVAPRSRVPQEASPPAAAAQPPPAPTTPRRTQPLEESDRHFLQREESKPRRAEPPSDLEDDPSVVPAPRSLEVPSADLPVLFADTPYATAPREIQESTLRRAQTILASRGFYREAIDGEAGPATEEAILSYQRNARLPLTGRLDLETLSMMRLLPGRSPVAPRGSVPPERLPSGQRVYRGIWIR
jgi:peptidoglycan hydrolase-like protein with peptidoglycan-binding domain